MSKLNIKSMDLWVAWSNTDRTEGKGDKYALHFSTSETTAIRLGKKGSVMGSDCYVTKEKAYKINGEWYFPGCLLRYPTREDEKIDMELKKKRDRDDLIFRIAKMGDQLGLTEEEIKLLI